MFERYTEGARRTLFFARYEASELGATSIEPEHLILGLLRDGDALSVLAPISLERLRAEIEKRCSFAEKVSPSTEMPFSAAAMRVLQFAVEEADRLRHSHIGSEHLLLGVLHEEDSTAAATLASHGVRLSDVRRELENARDSLEVSLQVAIPIEVERIKSLVEELGRTPPDSDKARALVTLIHESLDALAKASGGA